MTGQCPTCQALNQQGAGFCLQCGEPLDGDLLVGAPVAELGRSRSWAGRVWREPWWGVVGLLVLLAGLAVFSGWWGAYDRQVQAYQRGLADLADQRWENALTNFHIAGDYADAPLHYQEARSRWDAVQAQAGAADQAETAGAWWDAAVAWHALAALDPAYPDLAARQARAEQHAGVLVYRVPHGPQAGIWWAQADGSRPQRFPAAGDFSLHGISPDGRWAVYTVYQFYPWPPGRHTLYVLDLQSGAVTRRPIPPVADPDANAVRFRADGQGFWWVVGSHWSYFDLATQQLTPLALPVLAADTRFGRLLLGDPVVPASDAPSGTQLVLADATGRPLRHLAAELGPVDRAQFSPDGRLLSYQVRTHPAGTTVDTLMLVDVAPPGAPGGAAPRDHYTTVGMYVGAAGPTAPVAFTSVFLPLGPDGAAVEVVAAPSGPPFVVDSQHPTALFPGAALHLGAGLQVQRLRLTGDGTYLALHLATPQGTPVDWLGFNAGGRYLLYLTPAPRGGVALYAAPPDSTLNAATGLPWAGVPLLSRSPDLNAWTHNTALSHDGSRVLAILDSGEALGKGWPGKDGPGLYAFRLDGRNSTLVVPDATEFWTPDGWLVAP